MLSIEGDSMTHIKSIILTKFNDVVLKNAPSPPTVKFVNRGRSDELNQINQTG